MGASAKSQMTQVIPPSDEQGLVPAVFLDSSTRIRMVHPKEIRHLSRSAPIIVLLANAIYETAQPEIATEKTKNSAEGGLYALLDKPAKQLSVPLLENEAVFGDVTVNFSEMVACRNGEPVELTTLEFKTLKYLIQNARRVISRNELLHEVWGYASYPRTRTVDNHILRLRQKLEREPSRPRHLQTVHGAGYKFLP